MTVERRARLDASLTATIVSRKPLRYRGGANAALDRPAHVRAGSGLTWVDGRLIVVSDDTNFVGVIEPHSGLVDAIALPAGKDGARQFDDARGNKKYKLDLEACCTVLGPRGPSVLAFGSGSKKRRRRIVTLDAWGETAPRVVRIDADPLYEALEAATDFAGSDMNIEGVLDYPDRVRLFGRGNGAPKGDLIPVNATCDLSLPDLLEFIAHGGDRSPPTPTAIAQYELGSLNGLALGFTDVARHGRTVLYTAAAEASETASDDGAVTGSVLGVLPSRGDLRYSRFVDQAGKPTTDKVEGIAPVPGNPNAVYVVIDCDDATCPTELCEVRLTGPWH